MADMLVVQKNRETCDSNGMKFLPNLTQIYHLVHTLHIHLHNLFLIFK